MMGKVCCIAASGVKAPEAVSNVTTKFSERLRRGEKR